MRTDEIPCQIEYGDSQKKSEQGQHRKTQDDGAKTEHNEKYANYKLGYGLEKTIEY